MVLDLGISSAKLAIYLSTLFLFVHGFASIRYLFSCVYFPGYYGPSTAKGGRYTLLPSFLLLKMLLDFQPIYTPLFFSRAEFVTQYL